MFYKKGVLKTSQNSQVNTGSSRLEVVVQKVFLRLSQNSQKNACTGVCFFNKVADLRPETLLQEKLQHISFHANFRNTYFVEHL